MRVVILGHPRSGTGYTAHCFRQSGWDVGHEWRGRDGIASWMWAVSWAKEVPWGEAPRDTDYPETVLHVLREPAACVASVAYTEGPSEAWRARFVKIPEDCEAVERAVWSIYGWTRLIEERAPTYRVQLGSVERVVEKITNVKPAAPSVVWFGARTHPSISADEIKATLWVYYETAQMWDQIVADYEGAIK